MHRGWMLVYGHRKQRNNSFDFSRIMTLFSGTKLRQTSFFLPHGGKKSKNNKDVNEFFESVFCCVINVTQPHEALRAACCFIDKNPPHRQKPPCFPSVASVT